MNLDDMKVQWAAYDRKLEQVVQINHHLLKESTLQQARTQLRRQIGFTALGIISAWIFVPLMGYFIAKHHAEIRFVLPAAVVMGYFIGNMIAQIRQVRALTVIDYSLPVAAIQKQIESLVFSRVRYARWIFMSMVLMWVPIVIVGAKWMFNADLYALAPTWLVANVLLGLAFIPFTQWLSIKLAERSESPAVRKLMRDIAGSNLAAASEFLQTLKKFERNEEGTVT